MCENGREASAGIYAMKLGFDVDGVLASFIPAYQRLVVQVGERNLFQPGDDSDPPCWHWPEHRGYTKAEMSHVWELITHDPRFWSRLAPREDARTLALVVDQNFQDRHDLYFITSRPGATAKAQTETWLRRHCGIEYPTVL